MSSLWWLIQKDDNRLEKTTASFNPRRKSILTMPCIYTARYLLPGNAPLIDGGALLDLDGRIGEIAPLSQLRRAHPGVSIIDFGDALLLPALVNAHTHLELTDYPRWVELAREHQHPASFVEWIQQVIRVKHTVPQENYPDSLGRGIDLCLQAGTGAVGDILSYLPARKAYHGCPLRGRIYLEALGQDPKFIADTLSKIDTVLREEAVGGLELGLSPHSPYTTSSTCLAQLFAKCREEKLSCAMHVAESPAEIDFLLEGRGEISNQLYPFVGWQTYLGHIPGLRSIAYLHSLGGLQQYNLLVHGVQLNQGEIEQIAAAGCSVVLCPRSNARLDVGKAPVTELLRAGVNLALGTDSLASCDSLSIWDELAFAASWFAGQVDAPALFRMATAGGAAALGLGQTAGTLRPGADSSFQVLRPSSLPAADDLYDFLVAPGRGKELVQLYLGGTAVLPGRA
ncbi:MAG: amidohydrolase family protein [Desulfuromonadales bacterium]|nr:amidohydrolase family protein [Desulfuromonadales bacterium]